MRRSRWQIGMRPPAGQDFQLTVNVEGALTEADQFEQIIVKFLADNGGQITRIRTLPGGARPQMYSQFFKMDGNRRASPFTSCPKPTPRHRQRVRKAMAQYSRTSPRVSSMTSV